MNGEAKAGALNTVTNVGHSAMRVFTVPHATAASYLAQVFDPPCDERLADIADGHQLRHKSTGHSPLKAPSVVGGALARA